MRKLGYVYNRAAATLRTRSTKTVGLVMTDIANPFFAELTVGAQERFDSSDYSLILTTTGDDLGHQERVLSGLLENQAEGVLICPARGTRKSLRQRLGGTPSVLVTRYLGGRSFNYVGADNQKGLQMATEHLVSLGHRRIAFVGGPPDSSARHDRLAGFTKTLEAAGLSPSHNVSTPVSRTAGVEAINGLLQERQPPTAAVCYNDIVAIGVMLGLRQRGLEPGQDFSVVGFDDIEEAALWIPPLTTVAARPKEIGRRAADLLLRAIEDPERKRESILVEPRLEVRASTGKGPA
jgi:LacI family transcriptional regulator